MRIAGIIALALMVGEMMTGCVVVGATSRGGFVIWPTGFWLVVMILLVVWMLRRR